MLPLKIGALTIGQSPRPDLVGPLIEELPEYCQVIQAGALDGLEASSLPPATAAAYPLTTRLCDGALVMVEERFLAPKLQGALAYLEAEGVAATILLCAGTFAELKGSRPLVKPFDVGCDMLDTLGLKRIGLISPIKEQEAPIRQRWLAAGFSPTVWTADLARQDEQFSGQLQGQIETNKLECIVLDYVGHRPLLVRQLQERTIVSVIDLGQLALTTVAGTLQ